MATGISIHIGLNAIDPAHYGSSGVLVACEADAIAMRGICASQGFQTTTLLTQQATRGAVIASIRAAANQLVAGDILVLSNSSHGGWIPDLNGDETDHMDETWCLYDGQLLDDELFALWQNFRAGVRIVVFSDSCHSGTILKSMILTGHLERQLAEDAVPSIRTLPASIVRDTYLNNRDFYDAIIAAIPAPADPVCSLISISGCQDNQLSMDGPVNGAFTGEVLSIWDNGAFRGTYKELATAARLALEPTQSPQYMTLGAPNAVFEAQQVFAI